jgi:hypothetical protein
VCSNRNQVLGNTLHNSAEVVFTLIPAVTRRATTTRLRANTVNEACAGVLEATGETGNNFFNVSNAVLVFKFKQLRAAGQPFDDPGSPLKPPRRAIR